MAGHFDQEKEPFLDEKVDEYRVDQGLDPLDEKRLLDSQQPFPQPQVVPAAPPVRPEGDDIARRAQDVLEILHRARETTESSAREALALEFNALHMKGLQRAVRPDIVSEAVVQRLRSLPLEKGRALGIEYDSLVAVVKYKDAVSKKETKRFLWVLLGALFNNLAAADRQDTQSQHRCSGSSEISSASTRRGDRVQPWQEYWSLLCSQR